MASVINDIDEQLIEAVKAYNILYEKSAKTYKNTKVKAEVWKKYALTLKMSELECTSRWKCLRDKFVREHKKIQDTTSGSGADNKPQWEYYGTLSFLIKHIQPRKTISNVESIHKEKQCEDSEDVEMDVEDIYNVNDNIGEVSISSVTPIKRSKKMGSDDVGKHIVDTMGALKDFLNRISKAPAPEDDIFVRIRVLLNGLNSTNKPIAESKVTEYLYRCQIEQIKNGDINNIKF